MIDVARDTKGIRLAAIELLEEDFEADRIERTAMQASPESRARLLASVSRPTLGAGYLRWCEHLWSLEAQRQAGFSLDSVTSFEMLGLVAIAQARNEFGSKHPECSACKVRQSTRFNPKCESCGVSFTKRK